MIISRRQALAALAGAVLAVLGSGGTALAATGWTSIAAGNAHTIAVKADGTLWGWGSNRAGQVGDGTTIDRHVPVQIGSGFAAVAAGYDHSLGLKTDALIQALLLVQFIGVPAAFLVGSLVARLPGVRRLL